MSQDSLGHECQEDETDTAEPGFDIQGAEKVMREQGGGVPVVLFCSP